VEGNFGLIKIVKKPMNNRVEFGFEDKYKYFLVQMLTFE
jgi:hypothetical protein